MHATNQIYSHIICLQASGWDMDLKEILKYDGTYFHTSMFTHHGDMRLVTHKSTMKNRLKVEVTQQSAPKANCVTIDGSAILCVVHLATHGAVESLIDNVVSYVISKMPNTDVYLIFDKHEEYSIKDVTCTMRKRSKQAPSAVMINATSTQESEANSSVQYDTINISHC